MLTDHGSFVLLNLYIPNAGGSKKDPSRPRANAKMRFLYLLQQKVDALLAEGRQASTSWALRVCHTCSLLFPGCKCCHRFAFIQPPHLVISSGLA